MVDLKAIWKADLMGFLMVDPKEVWRADLMEV